MCLVVQDPVFLVNAIFIAFKLDSVHTDFAARVYNSFCKMVEYGGIDPEILVHAIRIFPDWNKGLQEYPCFEDAIAIEIDFQCSNAELFDCRWEIKYQVDHKENRTIVVLGAAEAGNGGCIMDCVDYTMRFDLEHIPAPADLSEHEGLLVATLIAGDRELLDVNVVAQVSVYNGRFVRAFLNPLA